MNGSYRGGARICGNDILAVNAVVLFYFAVFFSFRFQFFFRL